MSDSAGVTNRSFFSDAVPKLLRDTVLDAVDQVVRQQGWVRTSLEQVAKAAGVSRQTLYNEFGGRQSLAMAYIERRIDTIVDAAAQLIRSRPDDLPGAVRDAVTLFLDMVDEPLAQTVLAPGKLGPELVSIVAAVNARAVAPLAEAVIDARPGIDPEDAMAAADVLAHIAVAHVGFPVHTRDVALDRVTRVARMVDDGLRASGL